MVVQKLLFQVQNQKVKDLKKKLYINSVLDVNKYFSTKSN